MSSSRRPTVRTAAAPARSDRDGPLVLDRYRLRRRMGSGAFGTVWMARDERLERDVAVKILPRELVADGRFEREARAAARLHDPGIVTLFEAAVDDEGAYLVSELVLGETLDALLAEGRLSDRDIVQIGIALCDALGHAHAQGVVHRDVKPSNVLVPEGSGQAAKLTDFGVARVIDADSLTVTGDVIGTLAYMAPEQAEGLEAGEEADLYSLALVLYEALSGVNPVRPHAARPPTRRTRNPFGSGARLRAHLPPLRRQRRDLPGRLAQAIDAALRPRPRDRGSLDDLRAALADAGERVGEQPGVVTDAWTVRLRPGGPPTRTGCEDGDDPLWAPSERAKGPAPEAAEADPSRLIWQARALGAAGAAAAAAALSHRLLGHAALPLAIVALAAGALTLALPRLGWLATAAYICAAAAIHGDAGGALLVGIGALVPVVLLPASPSLWPVSAAAPALGIAGLGGAWPALAGWARSPWRRAMLGATGWLWLALATPIARRVLYLPVGAHPRLGSLTHTAEHVLPALARSGALVPAAVWALGAMVAPWALGGRSPALDAVRVIAWSAAVAAATGASLAVAHGPDHVSAAPTAVAGAVAGAVLALAPALLRGCTDVLRRR